MTKTLNEVSKKLLKNYLAAHEVEAKDPTKNYPNSVKFRNRIIGRGRADAKIKNRKEAKRKVTIKVGATNEDYMRIIAEAIQLQELYGKGSLEKIRGSYKKTHDQKTTKKAAHAWAKLRGNKPKPYDADDEKAMKLSTRKMDRADTLIGRRDWKKISKKQRSQYQKYTEE